MASGAGNIWPTEWTQKLIEIYRKDPRIHTRVVVDILEKEFGVKFTQSSILNKKNRVREAIQDPDRNETDPILVNHIQDQNNYLLKELEEAKKKNNIIVDACLQSLAKFKLRVPKLAPFKPVKSKTKMEMHLLRSDMQIGQVVDPKLVSGLNEYNFSIYKKELEQLTRKIIMFHDQDNSSHGLEKLVISFLGDCVEGETIYKGQPFYIDRSAVDQVFEGLQEEVHSFALPILKHCNFRTIEIFCVVGNHGRVAPKGMAHMKSNWDYVFYRCLKQTLESISDRFKVYVSESPMMLVQHGNFSFCYKHGDDVNSWMGIPYYGLDRMAGKISRMFGKIDYTLVGHFHQAANLENNIIVNGSFVGGSELSINRMGVSSVPCQKLFYFDKEHGLNRESNIYLANPVVLEKDSNNIFTPYT